ncbi:MAG: hypothetical protein KBC81_00730 [Candidatus Pacebacteria bacterium]|nr:hypothetical protein [Candidatus Paceibacterota bacterium]
METQTPPSGGVWVLKELLYHLCMNIVPADIINSIPFGLIALILFSLAYWVPSFFVTYHLTRFGIGIRPKLIALIFFGGSVIFFTLFVISINRLDLSLVAQQIDSYIKSPL